MNIGKELSPEMNSALQALALSDIEEGMGHNVTRAQGLQEELAQRRASLLQDSAEAQGSEGARRVAGRDSQRDGPSDSGFSPVPSTSQTG